MRYIFIFLVLVGCKTTKSVERVKEVRSDTLVQKTEVVRAPLVSDVLTIQDICKDSVLTEFERIFIRQTDTVTIRTIDGALNVRISQQERILSEKELKLQKQSKQIERLKETVKTRLSLKWFLILGGIILSFVVFPGIPTAVNTMVRKLIRFLIP